MGRLNGTTGRKWKVGLKSCLCFSINQGFEVLTSLPRSFCSLPCSVCLVEDDAVSVSLFHEFKLHPSNLSFLETFLGVLFFSLDELTHMKYSPLFK